MYLKNAARLYENLKISNPYWAKKLKQYLGLRCEYPCYKCPDSCKLPNDVKKKLLV
jgi:hypothetical protein